MLNRKGDTFKINTKFGYLSCMFFQNSWIVLHPLHSELNKVPKSAKIITKYRSDIMDNSSYLSTRILLVEKKIC
jgi:hypothetical protein